MVHKSIYCLETYDKNEKCYYNTVTKKKLPISASQEELKQHFFLAGQEKEALDAALFSLPQTLSLTINPTWECNLRCKHCCVLSSLKVEDKDVLPINHLLEFINKYIDKFKPKYISMCFVGGEPLLRASTCLETLSRTLELCQSRGIVLSSSMTTNATLLDDIGLKLMDLLDSVVVSVDGDEEHHNNQRIPLKDIFNPYERTLTNIERMIDAGFADKMQVQGAIRDDFLTSERYEAFLRKFAYMGIDPNRIVYGCIYPTDKMKPSYNESIAFKQVLQNPRIIPLQCCKFRLASNFIVHPNGDLYDVPFPWARTKLGNLTDSIDVIVENSYNTIKERFVCYRDTNCMVCPVIGYCWGGCVNGSLMVENRPSAHCNQKELMSTVQSMAESGELIKQTERQSLNNRFIELEKTKNKRIALQCI
jgi:radical SAM protein with 4Fe4S-binding SPASM domain